MIQKSEGFTLIEVLITLVILTIGLLGMAALTISVIQENAQSKKFTIATTLAETKLEAIKRVGEPIPTTNQTEDYGDIAEYPKFKRVTVPDPNNPNDATTVTVTVFWDSDNHSVAFSTIIGEKTT